MKSVFLNLLVPVFAIGQTENQFKPIFDSLNVKQHVLTLASDSFQGRKPFTVGEAKTIAYLVTELKKNKLEPGNHGSYLQKVELVSSTFTSDSVLTAHTSSGELVLKKGVDYAISSTSSKPVEELSGSEVVFVGYGIVAPAYHKNDYAGISVKGKVVIAVMNDPKQPLFLKNRMLSYYETNEFKIEEAGRRGAKAIFFIAPSKEMGFTSLKRLQAYFDKGSTKLPNSPDCRFAGSIDTKVFENILFAANVDSTSLMKNLRVGFKPEPLPFTFSTSIRTEQHKNFSYNVVARVKGTKEPQETIVYSAHWDHLGIGKPDTKGDSIYNGASDNAMGVSVLLELARIFKLNAQKPERTIVFLFPTAEELGLLGSLWYTQHLSSTKKAVANINVDGFNRYGRTKDLIIVGAGNSEMDDYVKAEISKQNRYIREDPEPDQGYLFRSDQLSFMKAGVPSLFLFRGIDYLDGGTTYEKVVNEKYYAYHSPADEYNSGWRFDGTIEDMVVIYNIGRRLAKRNFYPKLFVQL